MGQSTKSNAPLISPERHRLNAVLNYMPGLSKKDRELIELGFALAQEDGDLHVAPAWKREYETNGMFFTEFEANLIAQMKSRKDQAKSQDGFRIDDK